MKTALLVVDVQRIYTDKGSELRCSDSSATVGRINKLIERFIAKKSPVVFIRHMHKRDGSDLGRLFDFTGEAEDDFNFKEGSDEVSFDDRLRRPNGATEIVKNRYSAFANTELNEILRRASVRRVVVCGFMTNFCCESTARAAHDNDYYVDFIADATGTPGTDGMNEKRIRKVVGELLKAGFARVYDTASYLKVLAREL